MSGPASRRRLTFDARDLRRTRPGDHILVGSDVYGGTFRLFDKEYKRYGLEFSYVDMSDLDAVRSAVRPQTKLFWENALIVLQVFERLFCDVLTPKKQFFGGGSSSRSGLGESLHEHSQVQEAS